MNPKTLKISAGLLGAVALVVLASPAQALVLNTDTSVNATIQPKLSEIITKSDEAITARIKALNNLNARIQLMKNVSASEKSNITTQTEKNSVGLMTLKTKIDADSDLTTAKNDYNSIFGSYRIYALVIPQGYILAAADRVNTLTDMFSALSVKLQTRINEAQKAGKDVSTLQAALVDLNTNVAGAKNQGQTARSAVAFLVPDQGDKTKLASNRATLVAARANIKTATEQLKTARTDAKKIIEGLKVLNLKASATVSH